MQLKQIFLVFGDLIQNILLLVTKNRDLSIHSLDVVVLLLDFDLDTVDKFGLFILGFQKFFKILVKLNILFDVNFVTVHDGPESV